MTQVLQGVGGGFAATIIQVSAQARVPHIDVATVTALVLLITEVGNSGISPFPVFFPFCVFPFAYSFYLFHSHSAVGSAVATAVWTSWMPREIAKHVPGNNATLNAELYASITQIALYPADDPIRQGAIAAYDVVMRNLCIAATVVGKYSSCLQWKLKISLANRCHPFLFFISRRPSLDRPVLYRGSQFGQYSEHFRRLVFLLMILYLFRLISSYFLSICFRPRFGRSTY